jgi:hypothetical protein
MFSRFGILHEEKSGNPAAPTKTKKISFSSPKRCKRSRGGT